MARLYGRSAVGRRCLGCLPHGHWQTVTFVAALRHDRIAAPFLVEGPMDSEAFTAYLEHVLCPALSPGDTLILDNLSTHKIPSVGRLVSAVGAQVRYLPPYSPDLNPMEQAIAKLKAHLRQAGARTVEKLIGAVAATLDTFSASHCQGFFRHAQYASI
jgi:transposase